MELVPLDLLHMFFFFYFLTIIADIVPKNIFQIVCYYALESTILKFTVQNLSCEQVADLILMGERG